ncbi:MULTISPECIES: magnesium/cobalt transporter CorA [unclassified Oceanispirochaeta]|uniref:magnesium/cobalt transporter CorA n=1 Tax=unclassified Oceanispirochaeta TaxID=2635722 RepID=UPI000E09C486|nr:MULTISPECIES: magnesium/cobalt transporter CorA [unclassified Oceanispirochaeta]MBF9016747.1 magnesium/cobalt transporter CorA [Oceanispirochaeta sp. M2]NPD72017.1 magnesium/cobalt transporter CorA [Oceanispirochaeta sp. M1]RDG32461.1 magnesium and cobalt transport protein CorA [Oceanispirochaeta sp. M1]
MARFYKKRNVSFGKKPGEAVYIGNKSNETPYVTWISFDVNNIERFDELSNFSEISLKPDKINWLSVHGLSDVNFLSDMKLKYDIPSLVIADLMNTGLRPKISIWDEGLFLSMKSLESPEDSIQTNSEQVSFLLLENCLITFQETKLDHFKTIHERLDQKFGKVRGKTADYLLYSHMDCLVDQYISVVQNLAEQIETLCLEFRETPGKQTILAANILNRELLYLRKTINPVREMIKRLFETENQSIQKSTKPYISDLYSSVIQLSETIDIYKDILSSEMDTYTVMLNNKLNEIMKLMAIVSVIFLPMTLITGIYGTNFDFIPELGMKFGYLYLWAILLSISSVLVLYFKKKKWL